MFTKTKKILFIFLFFFILLFCALVITCFCIRKLLPAEHHTALHSFLTSIISSATLSLMLTLFYRKNAITAERLKHKLQDEERLIDALKKSEEKYRAIFDESSEGIILVDIKTSQIVDFNQSILHILHYSPEEFAELDIKNLELYGRDNIRTLLTEDYRQPFTTKKTLTFRTTLLSKSGIPVDVNISARKVSIANNTYLLLICKDISAETYIEKCLQDQILFANTLIEVIPIPIFYKNREGKYLGCNAAFEKFVGIKRDNLIGKSVFEIAPKEIAEEYYKKDKELFENPGTQIYDWKVKRPDGEIREVIFNKATYTDKKGNVLGLIGTITDITELREKNRELNNAYKQWQETFDAFDELIFIIDRDYKILLSNKALKKNFFGEHVDGSICYHVVHGCNLPIEECPARKVFEDGISRRLENFNPLLNKHLEITFYPLRDETGKVARLIHVIKDMTERKKAEYDLIRSKNVLIAQNKALVKWINPELILNNPFDLILKEILKEISTTLKTSFTSIWFFDSKKEKITCAFEYDSRKSSFTSGKELFVKDHPLYFDTILTEKLVSADNSHTDPGLIDLLEKYLILKGITSIMHVLIYLGKDPLGIICCEHTGETRNWKIEETNYLISMAELISIYFLTSKSENMQKTLNEQINRLNSLTAHSEIGLIVLDENHNVVFVNQATECFFGEEIKNILGRKCPSEIYTEYQAPKKIPIRRKNGEPGIAIISCENCLWEGKNAKLLAIKDITNI